MSKWMKVISIGQVNTTSYVVFFRNNDGSVLKIQIMSRWLHVLNISRNSSFIRWVGIWKTTHHKKPNHGFQTALRSKSHFGTSNKNSSIAVNLYNWVTSTINLLTHKSQPKFKDYPEPHSLHVALFPSQIRAAGTCRAVGFVTTGCICKHKLLITLVMDPGQRFFFSFFFFLMKQDVLRLDGVWHGKETRLTRKTRAVCNCCFSSLVS